MPILLLPQKAYVPYPENPDESGIVAIGSSLDPLIILDAYSKGIFPWFNENEPTMWWCPSQRMVLKPGEERIAKSTRNLLNRGEFKITLDQDFEAVINNCKSIKRTDQEGSWITDEMIEAYLVLHKKGFAHSVECWKNNELAGGLYGLSIGRAFFGDSMFSKVSNASKIAFMHLCRFLKKQNFSLIDCQLHNNYLESLGAYKISREGFLNNLAEVVSQPTLKGSWNDLYPPNK